MTQFCVNKDMKDAVRKHRNCVTHKGCVSGSASKNMVQHSIDAQQKNLVATQKRLRIIYFLCKDMLALAKFNNLMELCELNGAFKGLPTILGNGGVTYTSHDFVNDAVEVLANCVRAKTLGMIAASPFVGVMIDEATDITVTSQLVVYYKLCVNGEPKVVFAGAEKLIAGDGYTVASALRHRLKKDAVPIHKLVAFGSDGAGVMLGHVTGVAGRLCSVNPILIAIHCASHRSALGIEGAVDECAYLTNKYIPTVEHLGRYFGYSHARTSAFQDSQDAIFALEGGPALQAYVKICDSAFTRWLTHGKTNETIRRSFHPLVLGLGKDADRGDATGSGLKTEITSFPFVGCNAFLSDIFPVLDTFSLITQGQIATDLSLLSKQVPLMVEVLEHMMTDDFRYADSSHYGCLAKTLETLMKPTDEGGAGLEIKARGRQDADWLEGIRVQLLRRLIAHTQSRFPKHELMAAMYNIFNAPAYPPNKTELSEYLEPDIALVLAHYSKTFTVDDEDFTIIDDAVAAKEQFSPGESGAAGLAGYLHSKFRTATETITVDVAADADENLERFADSPYYARIVKKKAKKAKKATPISVVSICTAVLKNETLCNMFRAVIPLLQVYQVFITATPECERGVSVLKLIKTPKRNGLYQKTLEQVHVPHTLTFFTACISSSLDPIGSLVFILCSS